MPKPDAKTILRDARQLEEERFKGRNARLKKRKALRFLKEEAGPVIPAQYQKTNSVYMTPMLQAEGRQLAAMLSAKPVPHVPPPTPDDQSTTTKVEKFLIAAHQELETVNGHVWWKSGLSQIHEDIGWIVSPMKRDYLANKPEAPDDLMDLDALGKYASDLADYKQDSGISNIFDYRHGPTGTIMCIGDVGNPLAVYEVKEVDERELILTYDLKVDKDGHLSKLPKESGTLPSGTPSDDTYNRTQRRMIKVVEYWDREWCIILCQNPMPGWFAPNRSEPLVLDEWEHGWGEVPYFAAPAFENETTDEEFKFESPLTELYNEAPTHNWLVSMLINVCYLTGFPSWQLITAAAGEQVMDENQSPKTHIAFEPGEFFQPAPGQEVRELPMGHAADLAQQVAASQSRMQQFSLAPIAKGQSPGADTANSSLAELRRLQLSSLDPMSMNQANQARRMYRFWLERIRDDVKETVYVFDRDDNNMLEIAPEEILTRNLQVSVSADEGQDALVRQKAALEMWQLKAITELEFRELCGKENPEEWVEAASIDRIRLSVEPTVNQQLLAALGQTDAINQMIQANQQTGDANNAIPALMDAHRQILQGKPPNPMPGPMNGQPATGAGQGAGTEPRGMGVRSPAVQTTTHPT